MNSINNYLANPEWWFNIVVMGLVVGVAATYVRDWFEKGMSKLSLTLKKRYEAKALATEARTQQMLRHPVLLVLEYVRVALALAGSLLLLSAAIFLPVWHVLQVAFPAVEPAITVLGMPAPSERIIQYFALACGLFGMVAWAKGLSRLRFCELTRLRLESVAAKWPVNAEVAAAGISQPRARHSPPH